MALCCIVGCDSSRYERDTLITFYRFPEDPTLRKAWLLCIKQKDWTPSETAVVCSKHFEEKLFKKVGEQIHLDEYAIPTLFPTHQVVCTIEKPIPTAEASPTYDNIECYEDTDSKEESENCLNRSCESNNAIEILCENQIAEESLDENSMESVCEITDDMDENIMIAEECIQENSVESVHEITNHLNESQVAKDSIGGIIMEPVDVNTNHETTKVKEKNKHFSIGNANTAQSTEGQSTTVYRVIDATTETREFFENQLKCVKEENVKYKRCIKHLQQRTRRLNKKIAKMESFINGYRLNHVLSDACLKVLNSIPALDNEILTLQLAEQSLSSVKLVSECIPDPISDVEVIDCLTDSDSD